MKYLLIILTSLLTSSSWAAIAPYCGKIIRMKGEVKVLRIKKQDIRYGITAKKRMKLQCDDIILTERASRAKIKLNNKAILSMGSSTRISLEEFITKNKNEANVVNLTYGKVRSFFDGKVENKSKNKATKVKYKIKTHTAVAGVRGTDFFVSYNPNKASTEQATLKGSVEVQQANTTETVIVDAGKQVAIEEAPKVEANKPAPPAPKPLVIEPIKPILAEVIKQASVAVKDDKVFASKEAVAVIGKPETWLPPKDELPLELQNIKEVF